MQNWAPIAATVLAGALVAMQAPINSMLGRTVGTFAAAAMSFSIGLVVLVAIALVAGGFGRVGEAVHLQWYYLLGGVLGAAYVTTVLLTVRTLGAGGATAATIAGQLAMSVAIDRSGLFGLEQRPLTATRVAGVGLLLVGTLLIVRE